MGTLDRMLREYVAPVLRQAGFERVGRSYRLVGSNGDQAIIGLERTAGSRGEQVEFYVHVGVVPVPYWDWLCHVVPAAAGRAPEFTDGLWRYRVEAPAEVRADAGPWTTDLWLLAGADMVPTCGEHLVRILREEIVPLSTRLLDRAVFLAMARDPAQPLGTGVGPAEIMLLVDQGPSPELVAEIARCEALDPEDYPMAGKLAAWARDRTRH